MNMHGAEMPFQPVAGISPGQDQYMNQYVPGPVNTIQGQEGFQYNHSCPQSSVKRLRLIHRTLEADAPSIGWGNLERIDPNIQLHI